MNSSITQLDDTITAVSSARGIAARAIVRLSGPGAFSSTERLLGLKGQNPLGTALAGHHSAAIDTDYALEATIACPVRLLLFAAGHSYTGQDLVECHLPGSPALVREIIEKLMSDGVRHAEPGEFTARAYLHGRIDLTQAEAVAEIIHAATDAQLHAAQQLLQGQLHDHCRELADGLRTALAEIEAELDFAEEEDVTASRSTDSLETLQTVLTHTRRLLTESLTWAQLTEVPQVVLAGYPNAGKSTLMNRLVGLPRSISTAMAGTTRDTVSEPWPLPCGECLLVDTAGLSSTPESNAPESNAPESNAPESNTPESNTPESNAPDSSDGSPTTHQPSAEDTLEQDINRHTQERIKRADLVLWVHDLTTGRAPEAATLAARHGIPKQRLLMVANKADQCQAGNLTTAAADDSPNAPATDSTTARKTPCSSAPSIIPEATAATSSQQRSAPEPLTVSALTGLGIEPLTTAVTERLTRPGNHREGETTTPMALSLRQRQAIHDASESIALAVSLLTGEDSSGTELIALHLREALDAIGTITGAVTPDDILSDIFARFCIGK